MTIASELVVFIITVLGALGAIWAQIEAFVSRANGNHARGRDSASSKADVVASDLAAYRLHVAETYVSKSSLRDQVGQVMDLLRDVQNDVGSVNERLDRLIETGRILSHEEGSNRLPDIERLTAVGSPARRYRRHPWAFPPEARPGPLARGQAFFFLIIDQVIQS